MKVTGHDLLAHTTITIGGVETEVENAYALVNATFSHLWMLSFTLSVLWDWHFI
jgi:succinate dehydrogenase / fumarate reductase, cytochrome b subunit